MKIFIISIFIFLISIPLFANVQIAGTVVDENNQPIEYAQIIALNKDSIIVSNTQSKENGFFKIEENEVTILNISAFGFNSRTFTIKDEAEMMDTIRLHSSSITLDEVTVYASKPFTKLSGNSLVTTVAGSYLSQLGTANDVLGWIPTVTKQNENFMVFGKGKPLIYINGRKIVSNSELEQLSSKNIRDIQVISNPGAKYGASVKAVILIRTTKPKGDGFGMNLRVKSAIATYFSPTGQLDLTYRVQKFDLGFVSYVNNNKKKYESFFNQETLLSSLINESLNQTVIGRQTEYIEKFTINYLINKNHSVGGYYRLSLIDGKNRISNISDVVKDGISWDKVTANGIGRKELYPTHSSNVYYNGSFGDLGVDFNMDYYKSNPIMHSSHDETSLNSGNRRVVSDSKTFTRLIAHRASVSYNFKSSRIEFGEEYTNSKIDMEYNNPENILPSNKNTVKESNQSLFVDYHQTIGDILQFNAGLRYEHISYDYSPEAGNDTNKKYNNIFPSFGISTQLGMFTFSLSYSNKTERPTYSQLDGNMRYDNRYQYQKGNPQLKPVRKESLEFMAQYQPVFLQINYQNQRHPILFNAMPYNSDENINIISYINGPTIKELDVMTGMSWGKDIWNIQISGGVAKQWFKTLFNNKPISFNKPLGIIKFEGFVKLPYNIKFSGDYTFQTRGNVQNTFMYSHSILNISLYKTFCAGKFDIRIAGKDLFNRGMDKVKLYSGNIFISTQEKFDMRACEITLSYHLNVPKNRYKGKGAGLTEKERL